jgi:very-short-patch-repair endonuclease
MASKESRDYWVISAALQKKMVEIAKNLRIEHTYGEKLLWQELRAHKRGYKVKRQQPIGPFIVDFYIATSRLVIEIDGPIHEEQKLQDFERQKLLESLGLSFLRFSACEVEQNLSSVLYTVDNRVLVPPFSPLSPALSPTRGERENERKMEHNS